MAFLRELKKGFNKTLSTLARGIQRPVDSKLRSRHLLVMTLLIRNEVDIVEENIAFHLSQGVDFIVATDNGSTDGTRDILLKYAQQDLLLLIDEPEKTYLQEKWVNRMADLAYEKFGPCLIFHVDADEFWTSESGNLKDELIRFPLLQCLRVPIINSLPRYNKFQEQFPEDFIYNVVNPIRSNDLKKDTLSRSIYLFMNHSKVIYKSNNFMPHVDMGNHNIVSSKKIITDHSKTIKILHFPIRSFEQFKRKVIQSGESIASNPALKQSFAWHIRRWYDQYQAGELENAYRQHLFDDNEALQLESDKVIQTNKDFPKLIKLPRQI